MTTSTLKNLNEEMKDAVLEAEELHSMLHEIETEVQAEVLQKKTVKQLKGELKSFGLSTKGLKAELIERLLSYLSVKPGGIKNSEASKFSTSESAEESGEGTGEKDENHTKGEVKIDQKPEEKNDRASDSSDTDTSDESNDSASDTEPYISISEEEDNVANGKPRKKRFRPKIAFKDVADALPTYSGENNASVTEWVKEFEVFGDLVKWTKLEKYVYAKKQLRSSAKQYVEKELKPRSYSALKRGLLKEFEKERNSAKTHQLLNKTRKKDNETFRQYIYRMVEIASNAKIEEDAVVVYIVNGIPDNKKNKAPLYECSTVKRLKKKLKTYTLVNGNIYDPVGIRTENKQGNDREANTSGHKQQNKPQQKSGQGNCYNCGDPNHRSPDCPDKSKGPKCYNCNEFGHVSKQCSQPKKERKETEKKCCSTRE